MKIKTGILFRHFEIDRAVDREGKLIPLSFSSEEPVERWFGTEILDHSPGSVRMGRLVSSLPVLLDHQHDKQVAILQDASISSDRRGRGNARFGQSELAKEVLQDIRDGIRKYVSVGYQIHNMRLESETDDKKVYRAMDWEPTEVSIVSVPADITVGIGRGADSEFETEILNKGASFNMKCSVCNGELMNGRCPTCDKRVEEKERTRVSEIMAIGQRSGMLDSAKIWIDQGKSIESYRQYILDEQQKKIESRIEVGHNYSEDRPFNEFSEYLYCVARAQSDPRLRPLSAKFVLGERALSMGVGTAGGFAIPTQFGQLFDNPPIEEALIRSKSMVLPVGDPPDAAIPIPAMDVGTTHGRNSGFEVDWIGEGVEKPETDLFLRQITLEPHEVAGHLTATDKMLRNWSASAAVIEQRARAAVLSAVEMAFISGNGVGKPLGLTNAGNTAAITISRDTASQIKWIDVRSMFVKILRQGTGSPFWVTSSTCLTYLMNMVDDGSVLVWQPNARQGEPNTLCGLPIYIYDRLPSLGNRGDLMLLNLNPYYVIKPGSGPFFASSEHVYFTRNMTVFKVFMNIDAQPALTEQIPLEGDTSQTVSPFVILE